ncbi:hypothetical protein [Blastococcus sp. LR1]|uniref:hypothetical protein n=1 Tax=Blastococcus sp. LR1 TaxID=2877000 RepID=UPI001CCDB421|nr:hypothetical protein [Blastococcus sp. LR1]MCA0144564.1 hypothetical protein [Blastococcus sp. LR1]
MSAPDGVRSWMTRRRQVIGGVAAVLVLAAVVLGLVLSGTGKDGSDTAAAGTTTPAATSSSAAPSTPAPAPLPAPPAASEVPAPPADPAQLPPGLAPVAFDQEAVGADGVTARVVSLDGVRGTAEGAGNIAGPALRATVRLTNGTGAPVDLGLVSVTMSSGADATPASPLDDPTRVPFGGTLAPGGTAEGVYFFSVPTGERDLVTLTVGYRAGTPFLVFSGAAG